MNIQITYETPSVGQKRLSGTFETPALSGEFECPIAVADKLPSLANTENRLRRALTAFIEAETTHN